MSSPPTLNKNSWACDIPGFNFTFSPAGCFPLGRNLKTGVDVNLTKEKRGTKMLAAKNERSLNTL